MANKIYLETVNIANEDDSFQIGEAKNQHDNQAVQSLIDKSNAHEKDHQYLLAMSYLTGCVVPNDINITLDLLQRSAAAGNIDAADQLGMLYYHGELISQDYEKAFHWFEIAALDNHFNSLYMLALMYNDGAFVDQDSTKYLHYLEKSANLKYTEALFMLGYENLIGNLIPKNIESAIYFLEQAAYEDASAQYILGTLYLYGDEGLEPDVNEGLRMLNSSAKLGNDFAMYEFALILLEGKFIERDIELGLKYLNKSAELGNDRAIKKLKEYYFIN